MLNKFFKKNVDNDGARTAASEASAGGDRQRNLLRMVNEAASILLMSDEESFLPSLNEGIEPIANFMDIDRVHIWGNRITRGESDYVMRFEWKNAHAEAAKEHLLEGYRFEAAKIPEWEGALREGRYVTGFAANFSENIRLRFKALGIKSVLVIPIFMQGEYWGFLSFCDCKNERGFADDEISILRMAGLLIANAVSRHEAAGIVREADEYSRLMLDAMPLCCSLWDSDLNVIDCNDEAVKLFDLKDKKEYGEKFFLLFPEYQPEGELSIEFAPRMLKKALSEGSAVFECMQQRLDGTPIPAEITLVRVKEGQKYIITAYTRDLREHKEIVSEINYKDMLLHTINNVANILLQSETNEFESTLYECLGMMAYSVGVDRVYIWKNHMIDGKLCCSQVSEWSEGAEPMAGKDFTIDFEYATNIPRWEERLSQGWAINNVIRDVPEDEYELLASQNIKSILVVPVLFQDHFWGFVGFDDCHNEREFTINEEAILRSGSLLIANAFMRNDMTKNLRDAVIKMEEAAEAARAASRAKSDFLSNMSHEMRTPMNAIIGMTTIGMNASDVEKKNYSFSKIEEASTHLLGVINDILDMSKIEANKFELSEVEFSFDKMIQKVINVSNFRMDEKKQVFSVHMDKKIPRMLIGDDQRLAQVITNLLSNAVKFTPKYGSIKLDTRLVKRDDSKCEIEVSVKDSGIGISEEAIKRLFSSFEQAQSSTSRKYGGTGLGLAISKHIVELMGGRIWVTSEPNKGSDFSFCVELKCGAEDESLHLAGVNWGSLRVLVVDDELETREHFEGIAEAVKFKCDTADSGQKALELINKNGGYDVYFVDWRMPGMDGVELSRRIKELDICKSVIIMISAAEWTNNMDDSRVIDKFILKPLFSSTVVDCINQCVGVGNVSDEDVGFAAQEGMFRGRRILLAEDMEINREIVMSLLEHTEIEIECAENGVEAVDMFAALPDRYEIVFMDVQMPEMDGLEATRRIRALKSDTAKHVPIIAMTANVFKEDIEKCLEAGMNAHIGKPIDLDDLVAIIKDFLE